MLKFMPCKQMKTTTYRTKKQQNGQSTTGVGDVPYEYQVSIEIWPPLHGAKLAVCCQFGGGPYPARYATAQEKNQYIIITVEVSSRF
jgi:hypothetical protein